MKNLKKLVGWPTAWILYGLGDLISRPMNWNNFLAHLCPVYNNLMIASSKVQDWCGVGPWTVTEK